MGKRDKGRAVAREHGFAFQTMANQEEIISVLEAAAAASIAGKMGTLSRQAIRQGSDGFATDWLMKGPGGLRRIMGFTVTCISVGSGATNVTMTIGQFLFMGGGVGKKATLNGGNTVRTFRQHVTSNLALPQSSIGWHSDPHGTHQLRYWDGTTWTEHVTDNGVQSVDAVAVGEPSE
jgi:Protein of unknown function (DUF2510)